MQSPPRRQHCQQACMTLRCERSHSVTCLGRGGFLAPRELQKVRAGGNREEVGENA